MDDSNRDLSTAVRDSMELMTYFFNPAVGAKRDRSYQFTFTEEGGVIDYCLEIRDGKCHAVPGKTENPVWWVETDLNTWHEISGGYITGAAAMRAKRFRLKKGLLKFLVGFQREFSGRTDWADIEGAYTIAPPPERIRNVLILSCSGRAETGATEFFALKLAEGMKKAGANVQTLYPAKMDIHPCDGCFSCWSSEGKCVHEDDVEEYFDKFEKSDLLVFISPIYVYHGSTALKLLMDRLFQNTHHRITVRQGREVHPRRRKHFPYLAVVAVAGFGDMEIFGPLVETFRIFSITTGMPLAGVLRRPTAMSFVMEDIRMKVKDEVLDAAVQAGVELVSAKKISAETTTRFEQPLMPTPRLVSAANYFLDKAVASKSGFGTMRKR